MTYKNMETKNKLKKTDFRIVEIDESKQWGEDIVEACGGKITTVYFFDANMVTCLCEVTPSYYLKPLYCIPAKEYNEISSDMQENFDAGETQCSESYHHCTGIDGISVKPNLINLNGTFTSYDGKKYKELCENAEEYLRGNHQI